MTNMIPFRCTAIGVYADRALIRQIKVDAATGRLAEPLVLSDGEEAWALMTGVDDPTKSRRLPYEWWASGLPESARDA